jgi:NAD(P)-dependent dehydrogenase (short-subunit alcohol dehydrogenase family)
MVVTSLQYTPAAGSGLLEGAVAVVAGGSTGIGQAVVERFAAHGSIVEFAGIDPEGVEATETRLRAAGYDVRGRVVDLSEEPQVREYFAAVSTRHERLTVLVNSVGIQRYGTVESTPVDTWDEVLGVNLRSMFLTAKYAVPLLRRNGGGAIILVSSGQAYASQRNCVAYTASKGAIVALARAMAMDHAHEQIRVNSVCPGSVDTPMLRASAREMNQDDPQSVIDEWGSQYPVGRVGRPEEIADAIVFLASPLASFVTGADLRVDGGLLAQVPVRAPGEPTRSEGSAK